MFERLDQDGRLVMAAAGAHAKSLGSGHIRPVHLLLALVDPPGDVPIGEAYRAASALLQDQGLSIEEMVRQGGGHSLVIDEDGRVQAGDPGLQPQWDERAIAALAPLTNSTGPLGFPVVATTILRAEAVRQAARGTDLEAVAQRIESEAG